MRRKVSSSGYLVVGGGFVVGVGVNLKDSLGILGFSMNEIVTESQVRRRYMELARKFHPDKMIPQHLVGIGQWVRDT